jgi:hypothetical protein
METNTQKRQKKLRHLLAERLLECGAPTTCAFDLLANVQLSEVGQFWRGERILIVHKGAATVELRETCFHYVMIKVKALASLPNYG